MCGISGIVQTAGGPPVQQRTLEAMTRQMTHRGPDGSGYWIADDARAGLGHRRLAIVDLSEAGRQPMSNHDGSIQVTFNGEIYNYQELRAELVSRGYRFRSRTDTEVLVYLYEELGDAMIDRLDGDFAFGIWDDRRKRLLLARDRAGTKPLYYTRLQDRFLFASEIKALLAHPGVACETDEASLYHYLTYLVVPPPKTLFQDIWKLPAAGFLTLERAGDQPLVVTGKHWQPSLSPCELDESELDEQFRDLFQRSVEKRLMSDVPVGVLFSGGVDSTLNAASFARAIAPQQVRTFHVGVTGASRFTDDSDFAADMAGRIGSQHHQVRVSEEDLLDAVSKIARQQDEPVADPVCVPLYFVTKHARETGTTVLHAGEGADEIMFGYEKYRRFQRYHQRIWKPLSRLPAVIPQLGFQLLRGATARKWRKSADTLRRMAKGQQFLLSSSVAYYEHEKQSILSPDYRARCADIDSFDVVADTYRDLEVNHPQATFLQKLSYLELQLRLPELLLMRVDKMSMLNSVEVRVPFLDRDLIDFALAAPDSFKLRDGVLKEPVKRFAAEFVPREFVYRPKSGFGAPIQDWFASKLGRDMDERLHEDRHDLGAWFDVANLRKRLRQPPRTVNDAFQLWLVYNFLLWRRSFAESGSRLAA